MARQPNTSNTLSSQLDSKTIAADIAAFRKRGGRIEVLGNTPLRLNAPSPFRSRASERKPPTPVKAAKRASGR